MKILAVCPNALDSTSYYRAAGPLTHLRHTNGIETTYPSGIGWPDLAAHDVLFLQRPCTTEAVRVAQMARRMNTPVWVDWDDDPFSVPVSNAAFETYAKKEVRANIISCLALSTAVTVSTPALAEIMAAHAKKVTVVPNAVNTMFTLIPPERPKTNNSVLWRGSATHTDDLATVGQQIRDAIIENPKTLFGFFGYIPAPIVCSDRTTAFPNVRVRNMSDIFVYFSAVQQFAPKIGIVPLVDDRFNRSKSNIAWLEMHMAGAVILAPEMPEWTRPGIVNYRSPAEFRDTLSAMIRDEFDLDTLWTESHAYITEHLTLDTVNPKRMEAIG